MGDGSPSIKPEFYFCGERFDERILSPGEGILQAPYPMKVNGRTFLLRKMDRYLLFRDLANAHVTNEAFFLTRPLAPDMPPGAVSSVRFALERHNRAYGRCLLYQDVWMRKEQCTYLFFQTDGQGFARHEGELFPFVWDTGQFAEPSHILFADSKGLRPQCERIFREQVNPHLRRPYIGLETYQDTPLTWLCGSEAELRRLTHAFCCTEPGLFDGQTVVQVVYRGSAPGRRGGLIRVRPVGGHTIVSGRLTALGDLVFRCNAFTGSAWVHTGYYGNRQGGCHRTIRRVVITLTPPSMQERAEAYLTLIEWLEDKLHDPKKRVRYGLSAQPATRTEEAAP